ncbi:MAG: TetR family transcriptional regulator [Proteobacteria bacterium]|nr:TetR family transcriptional regulator [Pseudomonadota bacterium]MBU1387546.1 TetR family transcriptional regulator [Pseudomonadota bacterium]MBU1544021.1 TetR family transcriptional regulator [Pseudomonadota bacterium]MBU2429053.1 TetR family transcriptional regulator [Pseudomonadota bacterium]MBU2479743.1 TetR family transcriptional regulator [Pseudomonadota bacterium]
MKIGELEKRSGIPRSTIHHYMNCGLLHSPEKTGLTTARYGVSHLKRLEAIFRIKQDYRNIFKGTRVPLAYIKARLGSTLSQMKPAGTGKTHASAGTCKKRDATKYKILQASLELYQNRGYALTSIKDIADTVGISTPTFYRYFKDKRQLFVEVIEYVMKNFKSEIRESLKDEKDPAKRSAIMFGIFYSHYPNMGEILNQLRSGAIIGDQWSKDRLLYLYKEMMADLHQEIKRAIHKGTIKPVDPYLLSYFNMAITELALSLSTIDNTYSLKDVMRFVGDMLNNAFVTPEGRQYETVFYKPGQGKPGR